MRIIRSVDDLKKLGVQSGCVLTIGNFDGLHIGHQQIISTAKEIAVRKNAPLVMMTFEPHPLAVLQPQNAPGILTPRLLKRRLLCELQVDYRLVLECNREFLKLSAEDFLTAFLHENLQPAVVVEGDDFNFGSNRSGSIELLKRFAADKGFEVVIVDSRYITLATGQVVRASSTLVRYMLRNGHVADTSLTLGRPYRLIGEITSGRGIGRKLGFPTLNMQVPQQLVPAEGVYAGRVQLASSEEDVAAGRQNLPAAISIGRSKTHGKDNALLIEAHILTDDFEDTNATWIAMDFVSMLRDQRKFDSRDELSKKIAQDCNKAKIILKEE